MEELRSNSAASAQELAVLLQPYAGMPIEINQVPHPLSYKVPKAEVPSPFLLKRVLVVGIDAKGEEAETVKDAVKVRLYPVY